MNPVRAVCDTNVLISALLGSSVNQQILNIFKEGRIVLLFSKETLAELAEVLSRPKLNIPVSDIRSLFRVVRKRARVIRKIKLLKLCRDPKDDIILATAISGRAEFLITGDKDLLSIKDIQNFSILTPARFIEVLGHQS